MGKSKRKLFSLLLAMVLVLGVFSFSDGSTPGTVSAAGFSTPTATAAAANVGTVSGVGSWFGGIINKIQNIFKKGIDTGIGTALDPEEDIPGPGGVSPNYARTVDGLQLYDRYGNAIYVWDRNEGFVQIYDKQNYPIMDSNANPILVKPGTEITFDRYSGIGAEYIDTDGNDLTVRIEGTKGYLVDVNGKDVIGSYIDYFDFSYFWYLTNGRKAVVLQRYDGYHIAAVMMFGELEVINGPANKLVEVIQSIGGIVQTGTGFRIKYWGEFSYYDVQGNLIDKDGTIIQRNYTGVHRFFATIFAYMNLTYNKTWGYALIVGAIMIFIVFPILSIFFPIIRWVFKLIGKGAGFFFKGLWFVITLPFRIIGWILGIGSKEKDTA